MLKLGWMLGDGQTAAVWQSLAFQHSPNKWEPGTQTASMLLFSPQVSAWQSCLGPMGEPGLRLSSGQGDV